MNNLFTRTITATAFLAVMLAGLLVSKYLFAGIMIFCMAVMMWEFFRMTMGESYTSLRTASIATAIAAFILVFIYCECGIKAHFLLLVLIPVLALLASFLYVKDRSEIGKLAFIFIGLFYIAIPMTLSSLLVYSTGEFDAKILLFLFFIIWCSDVGAYLLGCGFGQKYGKKLFPSISPKKSWIGFWGGMAFAIGCAIALKYLGAFEFSLLHCIVLAILIHVAGVFGDLFESLWKRYAGVKDSGKILPGHGGFLDRFDSAIFAIPAAAVYLAVFNLL